MLIGLTGGICSGKTTIAKVFESLGAVIIDLDSLGHYILKNDPLVYERLVYSFGAGILNEKKEIDRAKLGRLVFINPDYLNALNSIIHPPIIRLADEQSKHELSKGKIVVLDVPLLIECNMTGMVDSVVLVYASEDTQMQRLMKRGLSKEDALSRIRSQMPFDEKKAFADFIIDANSSVCEANKRAKELWKQLVG
jgi:dephospho-CoA kinase